MTSLSSIQQRATHFGLPADLSEHALRQILSRPRAGSGVHNWLFRTARVLHPFYNDKNKLRDVLRQATFGCGRHVSDVEIDNAVVNSEAVAPGSRRSTIKRRKPWPEVNDGKVQQILQQQLTTEDLLARSPEQLAGDYSHAEEIIDRLFPADALLCCGWSKRKFETRHRERWRGTLAGLELIVPSPMTSHRGLVKNENRLSAHTLANTGARRFLVVEFDPIDWNAMTEVERHIYGTKENYYRIKCNEHVCLHLHLAAFAPLALIAYSGKKSLHGWYYCARVDESRQRKFMDYAVSLDADPATWNRSQFVRLPEGLRSDNGKKQTVLYYNPNIIT